MNQIKIERNMLLVIMTIMLFLLLYITVKYEMLEEAAQQPQPTQSPAEASTEPAESVSTISYMQVATPSKEAEAVKSTASAETVSTAESAEAASTDTPTPPPVSPTEPHKVSPSPSSSPKTVAGLTEGKSYTMTIYHYCACRKCTPGTGITASGKRVVVGMVAMHGLPFGTVVEFNGRQYTVEDRGVGAYKVDVYVEDHEEAIQKGMYKAEVKIVRMGVIEND